MILLCGSSTWLVVIEVEGLVYKVCLILKKEKKVYNQKSIYINNLFDIDCHVEKVYLTVS